MFWPCSFEMYFLRWKSLRGHSNHQFSLFDLPESSLHLPVGNQAFAQRDPGVIQKTGGYENKQYFSLLHFKQMEWARCCCFMLMFTLFFSRPANYTIIVMRNFSTRDLLIKYPEIEWQNWPCKSQRGV